MSNSNYLAHPAATHNDDAQDHERQRALFLMFETLWWQSAFARIPDEAQSDALLVVSAYIDSISFLRECHRKLKPFYKALIEATCDVHGEETGECERTKYVDQKTKEFLAGLPDVGFSRPCVMGLVAASKRPADIYKLLKETLVHTIVAFVRQVAVNLEHLRHQHVAGSVSYATASICSIESFHRYIDTRDAKESIATFTHVVIATSRKPARPKEAVLPRSAQRVLSAVPDWMPGVQILGGKIVHEHIRQQIVGSDAKPLKREVDIFVSGGCLTIGPYALASWDAADLRTEMSRRDREQEQRSTALFLSNFVLPLIVFSAVLAAGSIGLRLSGYVTASLASLGMALTSLGATFVKPPRGSLQLCTWSPLFLKCSIAAIAVIAAVLAPFVVSAASHIRGRQVRGSMELPRPATLQQDLQPPGVPPSADERVGLGGANNEPSIVSAVPELN